jgi:hypothetical protein
LVFSPALQARQAEAVHQPRLCADESGERRGRRVDVALREQSFASPARATFVSDAEPARAVLFRMLNADLDEPIHPTPKRQILACLAGAVRVTASDREAREIGPGDLLRAENRSSKGHHACLIGEAGFEAVVEKFDRAPAASRPFKPAA